MEYLLQCPLCFNKYDDRKYTPRQLPCQHIFCSDCLPRLVKQVQNSTLRKYIECPVCKEKHFTSLDKIPKSLVTIQLIETTQQSDYNQNLTSNSTDSNQTLELNNPYGTSRNNSNSWKETNPFYSDLQQSNQSPTVVAVPVEPKIEPWDTEKYLKKLFDQVDMNKDGLITPIELQEALRISQGIINFNIKTIHLLIARYDKNGDRMISFNQFFDLYCNLNNEFESFLMMDKAGNGYINKDEFSEAMINKRYNFSRKFFKFIVDEIGKHSSCNIIKFDNFIRAMARFDYLTDCYNKTPFFHNKHSLESYLKNTFFQDFW